MPDESAVMPVCWCKPYTVRLDMKSGPNIVTLWTWAYIQHNLSAWITGYSLPRSQRTFMDQVALPMPKLDVDASYA